MGRVWVAAELIRRLPEQGVKEEGFAGLKEAVRLEPVSAQEGATDNQTSNWGGRMVSKAFIQTWAICKLQV
jgi:hypothetical protein